MARGGRGRGVLFSAVAAIVIAVLYVVIRQRTTPELLVQSDEGWQPDVRAAVTGEVINPGTYTLHGDARIADLVTAAGGYTDHAERTMLNPAARVGDGVEYTIPTQAPRAATTTAKPAPTTTATATNIPATPIATLARTPTTTAAAKPTDAARTTPAATVPVGKVNINAASKDDLEALPAIGPAIAQRIIDDRTTNGPYKQIEDLARVRGISAHTVDELRDRITVGP